MHRQQKAFGWGHCKSMKPECDKLMQNLFAEADHECVDVAWLSGVSISCFRYSVMWSFLLQFWREGPVALASRFRFWDYISTMGESLEVFGRYSFMPSCVDIELFLTLADRWVLFDDGICCVWWTWPFGLRDFPWVIHSWRFDWQCRFSANPWCTCILTP